MSTLLTVEGLSVRFSGLTALDDVSFTLEDGNAKAIQTGEDVILVKLDDIQAADINTADAKPVNDELKEALNEDILAQYLNYLNEEISVSVNNSVINELYTPTAAN